MKKTVAGILIALVACLGFAAYFFLAINPPALSYMETNLTEQIKRQLKEDSEDSLLISIQRPGTYLRQKTGPSLSNMLMLLTPIFISWT